jgi:methylphosphotriester-DNA--protein-cysteine methyltransferase
MAQGYSTESARWAAVCRKDPAADGIFVYAVKTTKIYCRPICKARLARRANVGFYDDGQTAEESGFRACKRCKPEAGNMPEAAAVSRIRSMIEQELRRQSQQNQAHNGNSGGNGPDAANSTSSLAKKARVSKWHFHRVFKEITGVTPSEYYQQRGTRARTSLEASPFTTDSTLSSTIPITDLLPLDDLDMSSWSADTPSEGAASSECFDDMIDWSMFDQTSTPEETIPADMASLYT